jgi:hypothetical protein
MEVRQVFVSSENRDTTLYPDGNAYTLHLTQPVKDISKVELMNASIPNTLYNLPDGSNVMEFSNTISTSGDPRTTFSIPKGFYSAGMLATEITQAISNNTGISVSFLAAEGRFLFARTGSVFEMKLPSADLANLLGFNDPTEVHTSQTVAVETDLNLPLYSDNSRYRGRQFILSDRVLNLTPNEGIFLDIHELRSQYNEDAKAITANNTYSGQNISRTFGFIPMDVGAGAIKNFKKSTDYDFTVDYTYPIRKLDRLTVEWIDRYGRRVNFNGNNDNSFMLKFYTLRKNLEPY